MLAALYQPVGGDYNLDQHVDAADYVVWRKTVGNAVDAYSGADGSGNGTVDQADYNIWRASFGYSGPPRANIGFATFAATSGTEFVLEVVGTDASDFIAVASGTDPLDITITYQNELGASVQRTVPKSEVTAATIFTGLTFRGVYVRGIGKDDLIQLSGLNTSAIVEAGSGNDQVTGGSQADLVLGGRGSDTIAGGSGRDLLVGGRDGDTLDGGSANDIVIGGEPTVAVSTLDDALAAWNAHNNYENAVDHVLDILMANENVLEDQVVDTLTGGSERDLFFAAYQTPSNNDTLTDFNSSQEQVEVTHPPIPASQLVSEAVGAVYTGTDASIDYVRFIFNPSLWSGSTKDVVTLEVTLVELRGNGSMAHLQTILLVLSDATLVSLNGGPAGTSVANIDTTTTEINALSRLEVTTTLRGPGVLDGVAASYTTDVILDPVQPS